MKKLLAVIAAAAVALTLVGCDLLANKAGEGEGEGTKDEYTITVDATDSAKTPLADGKVYRRFMKQLGSSEQVAEFTTTISFDASDLGNSVVGLAFDFNKAWDETEGKAKTDSATEKLRDFYLFGFMASETKAYVEHYSDVNFKDEFDASEAEKSIGTSDDNVFGGGNWTAVKAGTDYTKEGNVYTLVISVKQSTPGQYDVYLGNTKLGTTKKAGNYKGTKLNKTENFAVGGLTTYVNVNKGNKVSVTYTTDKESVTGKFYADEE